MGDLGVVRARSQLPTAAAARRTSAAAAGARAGLPAADMSAAGAGVVGAEVGVGHGALIPRSQLDAAQPESSVTGWVEQSVHTCGVERRVQSESDTTREGHDIAGPSDE